MREYLEGKLKPQSEHAEEVVAPQPEGLYAN
jgi:hypothetical protein